MVFLARLLVLEVVPYRLLVHGKVVVSPAIRVIPTLVLRLVVVVVHLRRLVSHVYVVFRRDGYELVLVKLFVIVGVNCQHVGPAVGVAVDKGEVAAVDCAPFYLSHLLVAHVDVGGLVPSYFRTFSLLGLLLVGLGRRLLYNHHTLGCDRLLRLRLRFLRLRFASCLSPSHDVFSRESLFGLLFSRILTRRVSSSAGQCRASYESRASYGHSFRHVALLDSLVLIILNVHSWVSSVSVHNRSV